MNIPSFSLRDASKWEQLSEAAWNCRKHAYTMKTKVGASVLSSDDRIFVGCNIIHRFHCHDIHAEISALSSMVSAGCNTMVAILVVAERELLTPCGSCMDWIYELGGSDCCIGFQSSPSGAVSVFHASDIMPHYPR